MAVRRSAALLGVFLLAGTHLLGCSRSDSDDRGTKLALAVTARCSLGKPSGPRLSLAQWAQGAQLFTGLGKFHRPVTTRSAEAQEYFDQGMRYLWAFNHDESTRSFAHAALLDPQCAMCFWGVALTVGPNYNMPMMAQPRAKVAWEALQQAQRSAGEATPVEQALIGALIRRYPNAEPLDSSKAVPVLKSYADAMSGVAARFPDDLDVQTLYAEALMNLNAWKLWRLDGAPAPGTLQIVATLERVLAKDPLHPGANHYYIHAMEASPHPEAALASALRMRGMMPAAGHLEHMPAHILERLGHYETAAEANRKGVAADVAYFAKTRPPDYYAGYTAHNYQFLAFSDAMEGRRNEALAAVHQSRAMLPDEVLLQMPGMDWDVAETYQVQVRFGLWDQILAEPAPNPKLLAMTGAYLYARSCALAAKGRVPEAKVALASLQQFAVSVPTQADAGNNALHDVMGVAVPVAEARLAIAEKRSSDAIAALHRAVDAEDRLAYAEPADWFFPVRHLLGAVLLSAHQPAAAEAVYREDLHRHPDNGWALYGLAQALTGEAKLAEAASVQSRFRRAWSHADVRLQASAF